MKIIKRNKLDTKLASAGVVKSQHYEATAEYELVNGVESHIEIDEVKDADKERVVSSLIEALFEIERELLVFPRYTYFDSDNYGSLFHELNLKRLDDQAIIAGKNDINDVKKIVHYSFLKGWNVGWDLYVTSSDGTIMILVCHHDEFHIELGSVEIGNLLSGLLDEKHVRHEHYYNEG